MMVYFTMPKNIPLRAALLLQAALICLLFHFSAIAQTAVKVWEEQLVVPTYKVGPPEPNPIFYSGRAYQGAKGPIYPYPLIDKLSDDQEDIGYRAVCLENSYLKVSILPQLGGRIFSAVDKTNGYEFIYHQHVIKPALIGMLGAWISGGVEWNIPHHHRASTFMMVDHALTESADGSKTVWVGETELRHRMKWLIGITLRPDKAFIEVTTKLFNRTPLANSILYFSNVAVHANASYQVIFPPGTSLATYHGKNQFTRWPVGEGVFAGIDYKGVDLSWWKNHPAPVSFFAWNYREDFLAGYDHGKEAGIVLAADHHVVPGKKFFEWGTGTQGGMWEKILTDSDGPYLELMVGGYSDNQPDYSWCQPYEVKTVKQYWYPIEGINGVTKANREAAVNLELPPANLAVISVHSTSEYKGAEVLLMSGEREIFRRSLDIGPGKPFRKDVALPGGINQDSLVLSLISPDGDELISYTPVRPDTSQVPEPVKAPPPPGEIRTVEELYLTGLRLEQFYNPALEPYPYYEEALRRDSGDYRVNTALGLLYLKRAMWREAEERLTRAVSRVAQGYTSPKDGEAYYYLGVALRALGKTDAAYDAFSKATWSRAWSAAGYLSLAELECQKEDLTKALELIDRSISENALNTKAQDLKTVILRKSGRLEEAVQVASATLSADPLDFWAANELYMAKSQLRATDQAVGILAALNSRMRDAVESYLELAADYGNCGFLDEAMTVLSRLTEPKRTPGVAHPMVYYTLGYLWEEKGNRENALRYYRLAASQPPDYCFPFQTESIEVLKKASAMNPADSRALYYLGNILYDRQSAEAIKAWEASRSIDSSFSIVHRNLGLAYARVLNDVPRAIASLEKAVASNQTDPRLYMELDQMYEAGGAGAEKRLALFEQNQQTVLRSDDALAREIALHIRAGHYNRAIGLLVSHHFHIWEGGGSIHDTYVDACLLSGREKMKAGEYQNALEDFGKALEYPENLEVGRPYRGGRFPQIYYYIGTAYEALADKQNARSSYEKSVSEDVQGSELAYYQGLALRKLGKESDAKGKFDQLQAAGKENLGSGSGLDYFAKFGEKQSAFIRRAQAHYLMGLGLAGGGDTEKAAEEFKAALALNPNHTWAGVQLAEIGK